MDEMRLGPRWSDADAEYRVLIDVLLPLALVRLEADSRDDDSTDTQTLTFLAIAVAVLGVLVSTHDSLNAYWWLPALVCMLAGTSLGAALVAGRVESAPNASAYHEALGEVMARPLDAARGTLFALVEVTARNNERRGPKLCFAKFGCALLFLGLLGCIPIVAVGPT